jgi:hypothetical protein
MRGCVVKMTIVIVIFMSTISSSLMAAPHWQSSSFIEESFLNVALGTEFTARRGVLHKWVKPIRIFVHHDVPDQALHESLLEQHLAHLRRITGHDIRTTQQERTANVHYFFTQESNLIPLLKAHAGPNTVKRERGAVCIASFRTDSKGNIAEGRVFIPVDRARMHGKLLACIVEEITQLMGLPRDSEAVYPSIFNDKTPDDLLTGLDDLLLRILYNGQLRSGMDESQLRKVLPRVIQSLSEKGMIRNAEHRVREQGALYQLF